MITRILSAIFVWLISISAHAVPSGYVLVKEWDFGVNIVNLTQMQNEFFTRYIYNSGTLDHFNSEWQRYRDNNNHVFSGDHLSLVARIVGGMVEGGIESGMLRSKWTGKYGYYEARVKVPPGRGMWPAFWMISQDQITPPEIDIMEIVNNGIDNTNHSFHFTHGTFAGAVTFKHPNFNARDAYQPGFDFAAGYHKFAVEWTPTIVRWYVDDVLIKDQNFQWLHNNGADGGAAHVLINLAVGDTWPGDPQSTADFPASYEIDYIRVWQVAPSPAPLYSLPVQNAQLNSIEPVIGQNPVLRLCGGPIPSSVSAADGGTSFVKIILPADWLTTATLGFISKTSENWEGFAKVSGAPTHWRIYAADGTTAHIQSTFSVNGGTGAITLADQSIITGKKVRVNNFTITAASVPGVSDPLKYSIAIQDAKLNTIQTVIGPNPVFKFLTGAVPASVSASDPGSTVSSITLPTVWLGPSVAGVVSKSGTWTGTATLTGIPTHLRIFNSAQTIEHIQGDVTGTGGGGLVTLSNTSIVNGDTVTVPNFSLTAGNQ